MEEKRQQTFCNNKLLQQKGVLQIDQLQKGGDPAAPSGTATLLRLSPSYQFYPKRLL
jgi:hypothetical protein